MLVWHGEHDLSFFYRSGGDTGSKGGIVISEMPYGPELASTGAGSELLEREHELLQWLFLGRDMMVLDTSAFTDLKDAQAKHFDALMEEEDTYFCSPFASNRLVDTLAGWIWPLEARRRRSLRRHVEGYRRYLHIAMRHRLDPVYKPGGQLDDISAAMPYLLAFNIENSWADEFAAKMARLLDDTVGTTSLYDLGDRALKQSPRQRRYRNQAAKRKQENVDRESFMPWWLR